MSSSGKVAISNSKLVLTKVAWKCDICSVIFPNHNALIEHLIEHFRSFLKKYPYFVQEEIIKRLIDDMG